MIRALVFGLLLTFGFPMTSSAQSTLDHRFDSGLLLLVEESHALPLVEFQVTLRTGSAHDPADLAGLARTTARMIRMGTPELSAEVLEERIDAFGASLSVEVGSSYTRFSGSVIRRNVEPFFALLGEMLAAPAFREADLAQVERETLAALVDMRDDDRTLAAQAFREAVFGADHPYGRRIAGTRESVSAITVEAIRRHWQTHYVASNAIVGFAGDVTGDLAKQLTERAFGAMRAGSAPADPALDAPRVTGRRVVVVDKPERTQTQIFLGSAGTRADDPDHFALLVANTVFGGTFTSRLMREVRSVRGWSYGASSRFGIDRGREAFSMWTFPAVADAVPCVTLELELLEALVRDGITADELAFAQGYLGNSHAFEVDTAAKRLEQRVDVEVFGLPHDYYSRYVERLRAVTLDEANAALRARLSANDLVIVMLATASEVREALAALPGVQSVEVVPFDAD